MPDEQDGKALAEKLATQAETGGGRTMAKPAALTTGGTDVSAGTGMGGAETNDAMPEGGATGDSVMPDTVAPGAGGRHSPL